MSVSIRPARQDDVPEVLEFTSDTWSEHGRGDYLPAVFETWVATDGPQQRTFVAERDGVAVGTIQSVLLSPSEAWLQGLRVSPAHRGEGVGTALTSAGLSWARSSGAAVARCIVFSWNEMGLGLARAAGFDPATEFRWAHPEPATAPADAVEAVVDTPDPAAAWDYWRSSTAATHLDGLALDTNEPWALSELTADTVERVASDGRLIAVRDEALRGLAFRVRTADEDTEGGSTRWAEYGVGAWTDPDACERLMAAIARDAATCDADETRVLFPETVETVSDVALAGHRLADHPDYVLAADLTDLQTSG